MRRGELMGLQWQDVDLVRGALAVRWRALVLPPALRISHWEGK